MSDLTRRSLLAGGLLGAASLSMISSGAQAQGYGQAAPAPQGAPAAANQVAIQDMAFVPAALTVAAGTTLAFANRDGVAHTVTSDSGAFDVALAPGQEVRITFPSASTYAYHCEIHPSMRGSLTVV